jgi:hypothetical protein
MAVKSLKPKSKSRPAAKTKAKRGGSKALLIAPAVVRTAKPASRQRGVAAEPVALVANPSFGMFHVMGRVVQAYAEFPFRLAQCRTPMDVWREQVQFAQRIFG